MQHKSLPFSNAEILLHAKSCFMRYFDFHAHIILKQLFSDQPNIDTRVNSNDVTAIPRWCTDLPNIIQTQTHQSQLASFKDEVLIGAVLYACESYLAKEVVALRSFLKPESGHKMSIDLLSHITDNSYKSFSDFIEARNLPFYINAPQSFNVLTKDSFNHPLPTNKVNIFFTIEGCHSLVDTNNYIERPGKTYPPAEILGNLDKLLAKVPVLSVNPTHMQQSNLCNQAFAIQLTSVDLFIPREYGLTDDGKEVIQGLFDRGICVDVKHMSYKSRFDLRKEIDAGFYTNAQPIVCSHAGFTGISFSEYPGYIFRQKDYNNNAYYLELVKTMQTRNSPRRPGAPAFNMTTINLFNEEIVWIIKHGGIIGLCLDRRILGYVSKFDDHPTGTAADNLFYVDKEYISKQEWKLLGLENKTLGSLIDEDDCVTESSVEESVEANIPARDEYFYRHILLHIKHFFQVCIEAGITIEEAGKHLSLGADYDGFINPFINIATVEDLPQLKQYIRQNLKDYLLSLSDSKQWANQLDIDLFTENFFYNNGYDFVKSRFQNRNA